MSQIELGNVQSRADDAPERYYANPDPNSLELGSLFALAGSGRLFLRFKPLEEKATTSTFFEDLESPEAAAGSVIDEELALDAISRIKEAGRDLRDDPLPKPHKEA